MNFRSFLESTVTFMTAQGSTYVFDGTSTRRHKTVHMLHDPADHGDKPPSAKTVFITPGFAKEVGMWGTSNGTSRRLVLANQKVYLLTWNDADNRHGLDIIHSDSSYTLLPVVGKNPLELLHVDTKAWPWRKPGMEVYAGSHPGNVIVKVDQDPASAGGAKTVFITPALAREISAWEKFSTTSKRLVLANNKIYLLSWNNTANKHGLDTLHSDSSYTDLPEAGRKPLELTNVDNTPWEWRKPGMEVYKSSRP